TKPILYRHFGDRGGLVQAAADRFGEDLVTRLAAALGRSEPSRARLAAAIDAYLAFVEEEPGLYRYLTQHAEAAGPALTGVVDRVGALIAREIGEGLRAARADSGAAEPWAYGIVGMIHMAGAQWVARPTLPRQRLVEYLTTLVWDGMGSARPLGP
ncbi:MAG TPA: hypothetical protein VE152_09085, partial [Acidimicrobiales bacterium]|nr:hypothetical protein [Acidimicrobiales bacterium]